MIPEDQAVSNLIDREALMETFEGAEEVLITVIGQFFEEQKESLNSLESALNSQNSEKVGFEGHTFKGMVSNFQAPSVTKIALSIEQAGKSNDLLTAKERYAELVKVLEQLNNELNGLIKEFS